MSALPLTIDELYDHALHVERDLVARFRVYARCMRERGAAGVAEAFDELCKEEAEHSRALAARANGGTAKDTTADGPSPWETVLEHAAAGVTPEEEKSLLPRNPREAIQRALLARKRGESFYADISDDARNLAVRMCAAELAVWDRRQMLRLQRMLFEDIEAARLDLASR